MNAIAVLRDHEYDIRSPYWSADFPSVFREKQPLRLPNMRHGLITVPEFDKCEKLSDAKYIAGWGTGMGVDYNNEIGVVTNIAPYGYYFRPDAESGTVQELVQRQYVGNAPEKGDLF